MVLTRRQAQIITKKFNNISINQQVDMVAAVENYVLIPFEGNINHGYPQGIKNYLQATKETYKEAGKLYPSV